MYDLWITLEDRSDRLAWGISIIDAARWETWILCHTTGTPHITNAR